MNPSTVEDVSNEIRHKWLKAHPRFWASVGVLQTLLAAGIVFGWASLLPILRNEGVDLSAQAFTQIFTYGAIGNYISTLFFGVILDRFGPRWTGILSSILFASGLCLASYIDSPLFLTLGVALLGFAGPGIQMPTLHLANLFGDGSGGALFMSAQAAAFDGGTAVFAVLRTLHQSMGVSSTTFLRLYLLVPGWVLLTSVFVWPDKIVSSQNYAATTPQQDSYVGAGSPYLSPRRIKPTSSKNSLVNAPLSVVLRHPAFYALAVWVSVHILKLNFIVATINDQLDNSTNARTAARLIDIFGAMLPFGFVVLPVVAYLLDKSAIWALQLANVVGILYGGILLYFPGSALLQSFVVFPAVASSRQMVYSTVFHQIGQVFGFDNYGVLLGLTNVFVSTFSAVQTPLVAWSEAVGSYTLANTVLLLATLPLFGIVFLTNPSVPPQEPTNRLIPNERTPLGTEDRRPRSNSAAQLLYV